MKTKLQLKSDWKNYLAEHQKWKRTIDSHHYFRSRYASQFWLKEIEKIYEDVKRELSKEL